ncbi:FecR domain-containing protein [Bdellovibrio sp. HCB337]|uniref:FecR family protein n=1 Tax=Bdellovibrio sp. HCB337 TaxID=3394358 RepID=UPI0039A63059
MMKFIFSVSLVSILFFASSAAFAEPMYGVLMVVKGSVKITNAGKTADGKVGGKVYEGDKIATGADSRVKIVMSDRNVINVSPDSEMVIAKYENDAATGKKDVELNLLKGKVRNNVEQTYDGEKNKFLIKTPTAVAGVRGTQFLAGFDPSTRMTSIVTFKGSVNLASVGPQGKPIGAPVIIKKGEMTQAGPDKAPDKPKAVPKEDMKKMDGESTASMNGGGDQKRDVASDLGGSQSMVNGDDTLPTIQGPPGPLPPTPPPPPPIPPTPPPVPVGGKTNVNIKPVTPN